NLRLRRHEWRMRLWRAEDRKAVPTRSGPRSFRERGSDFEYGQPDFKCGSALGAVVTCDLSLVVLDYAIGGAESETGTFANRLGGVERIEDALGIAQTGTGVGELDDHLALFAPE